MNTPTLRFKEFSGEWEVKKLGAETTWSSGGTPSKQEESYWDGDIPWISASSMRGFKYFDSDLKITNAGLSNGSRLAAKGSLLLLVRGSMLFNKIPVGIATKDVAFNQDVKSIKTKPSINNEFLLYWFFASENKLLNMVSGTGIGAGKLDTQDLLAMDLSIPTLPEQTKIANFLTAIDEKIAQLSQTAQLLTDYKKGVMQQIFSQQLRFKDDDGREFAEWEEKSLGEVFAEIKDKVGAINDIETYSISAGKGFVSQQEKFGKDISGNQNQNYISLKPFEFAYNKGSSKTFKYGCVYPNTTGNVISVPNVFISFRSKLPIATHFYSKLFEWHYLDTYLKKIISSSARMDGLLNVSKKDFFEIEIPYPCIEEQTKIANFLTAIDDKINHNQTQLDAMKQYKSGLLQQMFV